MTPQAVFVYGTLKSTEHNHSLALEAGLLEVRPAHIEGYTVHALEPEHYPALREGEGTVHGELLTFEDLGQALEQLDWLEAIHEDPPEYRRAEVQARLADGSSVWAYVYLYVLSLERPGVRRVESGVWQGQLTPRRGAGVSPSSSPSSSSSSSSS